MKSVHGCFAVAARNFWKYARACSDGVRSAEGSTSRAKTDARISSLPDQPVRVIREMGSPSLSSFTVQPAGGMKRAPMYSQLVPGGFVAGADRATGMHPSVLAS